jgi:subtilase family serine protease
VADLVISSLAAPATATSGTSLGVHVVVTNRGTAPTPVSRLRVYLSTDAAVSTGDLLLHDGSVAALAAGAAQSQTLTVPVPATTPAGAYALLLVVNADGAVKESTLGNNVAAAPLSVVRPVTPMPDLVLTKVAIPTTLQRGVGFGINFTVVNQGTAAARDSRVKIYLSSDAAVSSDDRLLRSRYVVGLAAGASQAHGMEQTLPAEVKPGAYSLLVVADAEGVVAESSEKNNLVVIAVQVR